MHCTHHIRSATLSASCHRRGVSPRLQLVGVPGRRPRLRRLLLRVLAHQVPHCNGAAGAALVLGPAAEAALEELEQGGVGSSGCRSEPPSCSCSPTAGSCKQRLVDRAHRRVRRVHLAGRQQRLQVTAEHARNGVHERVDAEWRPVRLLVAARVQHLEIPDRAALQYKESCRV
eukprot:766177-Hanusia_phi.AAC.4